jgi:hypothetical protein
MIAVGDWLYCFKTMRGFHITGDFVDLKYKNGELLGKFNERQFGKTYRIVLPLDNKIKQAYLDYIAERELLT